VTNVPAEFVRVAPDARVKVTSELRVSVFKKLSANDGNTPLGANVGTLAMFSESPFFIAYP
jgi:hypothetical protein